MSDNSCSDVWGTLTDNETNTPLPLRDKIVFAGRSEDCQVRIVSRNTMVSATHFSLEKNEVVTLQDLSKNGTLVVNQAEDGIEGRPSSNVTKLKKGERSVLVDGCTIAIPSGRNSKNYKLSFRLHLVDSESSSSSKMKKSEEDADGPKLEQNLAPEETPAKRQKMDEEEPQPSTAATAKLSDETKKGNSLLSSNIGEKLLCTICYEILYQAVSLQPCLHNFCGGCACEWLRNRNECPNCRKKVTGAARNHFVVGLVNDYIEAHPESQRDKADIKAQDKKNVVKNEMLTLGKIRKASKKGNRRSRGRPAASFSSSASVEYSFDWVDSTDEDDHSEDVLLICRQCPNNNNTGLYVPDRYVCHSPTDHISCNCCLTRMPLRTDSQIVQKCFSCRKTYCNLYWGDCNGNNCQGNCFKRLKDHTFDDNIYLRLILDNLFESNILKEVLDSRNHTWADILREGCHKLDNFQMRIDPTHWPPGICTIENHDQAVLWNSDSPFCKSCATLILKDFAYAYRHAVALELLPEAARGRSDCYWGKNCRTQRNRPEHARKLNHICEQTKFN